MTSFGKTILAALILVSLVSVFGTAQQTRHPAQPAVPSYDPLNQYTLRGKVVQVKDYECPISGTVGSHLAVSTEDGIAEVHLGPAAFLKEYDMTFLAGDEVTVIGIKFIFEGKPAMMAKTVSVAKATYMFRDEKGRPLW